MYISNFDTVRKKYMDYVALGAKTITEKAIKSIKKLNKLEREQKNRLEKIINKFFVTHFYFYYSYVTYEFTEEQADFIAPGLNGSSELTDAALGLGLCELFKLTWNDVNKHILKLTSEFESTIVPKICNEGAIGKTIENKKTIHVNSIHDLGEQEFEKLKPGQTIKTKSGFTGGIPEKEKQEH